MSLTWVTYQNHVNVAWVVTGDADMVTDQFAFTPSDQEHFDIEYLGAPKSHPGTLLICFNKPIGSATNALNKARSIIKAAGCNGFAVKEATPPDAVHLAEWGYNFFPGHIGKLAIRKISLQMT